MASLTFVLFSTFVVLAVALPAAKFPVSVQNDYAMAKALQFATFEINKGLEEDQKYLYKVSDWAENRFEHNGAEYSFNLMMLGTTCRKEQLSAELDVQTCPTDRTRVNLPDGTYTYAIIGGLLCNLKLHAATTEPSGFVLEHKQCDRLKGLKKRSAPTSSDPLTVNMDNDATARKAIQFAEETINMELQENKNLVKISDLKSAKVQSSADGKTYRLIFKMVKTTCLKSIPMPNVKDCPVLYTRVGHNGLYFNVIIGGLMCTADVHVANDSTPMTLEKQCDAI